MHRQFILSSGSADLALSQSGSPSSVHVGDRATFTAQVRDSGPDGASFVVFGERLSGGAGVESLSASQGVCLPPLRPGYPRSSQPLPSLPSLQCNAQLRKLVPTFLRGHGYDQAAMRRPLAAHLAAAGADRAEIAASISSRNQRHRLAQEIAHLIGEHVGNDIANGHAVALDHRGVPFVDRLASNDESGAHGGRTTLA